MTFFDTVAGQRFTEGTLPRLIEEMEKMNSHKQHTREFSKEGLKDALDDELSKGYKVVSVIDMGKTVLIVFGD